jgi:hypothetical protein
MDSTLKGHMNVSEMKIQFLDNGSIELLGYCNDAFRAKISMTFIARFYDLLQPKPYIVAAFKTGIDKEIGGQCVVTGGEGRCQFKGGEAFEKIVVFTAEIQGTEIRNPAGIMATIQRKLKDGWMNGRNDLYEIWEERKRLGLPL